MIKMATAAVQPGRPKTSLVCDYFKYDVTLGKTVCQIDVNCKHWLLESKGSVCLLTEELKWNGLQTSKRKKINNIVDFLQPFAEYITLCCGEDYTSLSAVVPIIMELNCHLQEMQKQPGMGTVARVLVKCTSVSMDILIHPLTVCILFPHYLTHNII